MCHMSGVGPGLNLGGRDAGGWGWLCGLWGCTCTAVPFVRLRVSHTQSFPSIYPFIGGARRPSSWAKIIHIHLADPSHPAPKLKKWLGLCVSVQTLWVMWGGENAACLPQFPQRCFNRCGRFACLARCKRVVCVIAAACQLASIPRRVSGLHSSITLVHSLATGMRCVGVCPFSHFCTLQLTYKHTLQTRNTAAQAHTTRRVLDSNRRRDSGC